MSYQTAKTIKSIIDEIDCNKYLLPAIQREFVWSTEQIERLFDSLMCDYPISSFLFWKVTEDNVNQYEFYKFLKEYHEMKSKHNPKAYVNGRDEIIAVLDGQQRLTSLYIALMGTYAYKLPRKRYDNPQAYPKRKLYLNLLKQADSSDEIYEFKFLTDTEANKNDEEHFWFPVGKILEIKEQYEISEYLIEKGLNSSEKYDLDKVKFANRTLHKLYNIIHEKGTISYYLEECQELDKVLNIFIRINSGGTILSYSDLLLSIATAQWEKFDAREEITEFVDEINDIGNKFNINKDFVLKACLVLSGINDIAFKVDNFNKDNMLLIEEKWAGIKDSICIAFQLIDSFGYTRENLTSNNAVIPIAYYIYKNMYSDNFLRSSKFREEREKIRKWLIRSLLKRVFSGQPDNVLRVMRSIIKSSESGFPIDEIINKFKGTNKTLIFTDEDIENLLWSKYGNAFTFSILQVLYPTFDFRNKFHVDHMHPKSLFTPSKLKKYGVPEDNIDYYRENVNYIGNLQLLDGQLNIEKNNKEFKTWVEETFIDQQVKKDYFKKHFIPNVDLDITNFENFLEEREENIKQVLKSILQ